MNPAAARVAATMRAHGQRNIVQKSADTSRLEQSWSVFPVAPEAIIYQYWRTMVARSREQINNNDHARKFIGMVKDNVVGPDGFTLKAQIMDAGGKTMDTLASGAIEDAYTEWSKKGNCDVTGTLDRATMERQFVTSTAQDGEGLAIIVRGPQAGPWGFALQIMDPVNLNVQHYEKKDNGNFIRHGIEFTPLGRPVAYYFQRQEEQQIGYILTQSARDSFRVPAEDIIHCFIPELVGQKRGLPWMRTAMWRMRMLQGFEDSAVVAARVGAAKMGFFQDKEGESQADDEPISMDAEPGTFEQLPAGYEFTPFEPQYPSEAFDPFMKSCLRSISSGLGVSYNNLASDLTAVNFSSIRQGALDERETWKAIQKWMINNFEFPVFNAWLEYSILTKQIKVNGKPLRLDNIDKYKRVAFIGRRWGWISPGEEMTAYTQAVGQGFKSRSEVISETTNRDPEEVWKEIAAENDLLKKLDITPAAPPGSPPPVSKDDDPSKPKPGE